MSAFLNVAVAMCASENVCSLMSILKVQVPTAPFVKDKPRPVPIQVEIIHHHLIASPFRAVIPARQGTKSIVLDCRIMLPVVKSAITSWVTNLGLDPAMIQRIVTKRSCEFNICYINDIRWVCFEWV